MNITKLIVAAGFAVAATSAVAETGVFTLRIDNVANVYGRAGAANVQIAGRVVTRPPVEVVPGPEVVQGTTAVLVRTHDVNVDEVLGRA